MSLPQASTSPASPVVIEISEDRLTASCGAPAEATMPVALVDVVAAIQKRGVKFDKSALAGKLLAGSLQPGESIVVARGRPAVHACPARITLTKPAADVPPPAGAASSHYDRQSLQVVTVGQAFATWAAAVRGRDGVDVFGSPIPHRCDNRPGDTLGPNVKLADDGTTVVAVRSGVVRQDAGRLSIDPELHIHRNVDFSTGNIDFPGDVHIAGNIIDLFKLIAGGNTDVKGIIEAADVLVRGALHVHGGIAGKDKCVCRIGGDLAARYITNATIRAGGEITVQSEIAHCNIACAGSIHVDNGSIIAGQVAAAGGIRCAVAGSPSAVKTILEIGIDRELHDRCAVEIEKMEARRKQAQQIRQTVEPLLRLAKNLTAAQKEKATELLYNADEIDRQIAQTAAQLEQHALVFQANSRAELAVSRTVHAGTIIRFPRVEAAVNATMAGPVRIICSMARGQRQVMVIGSGGSSFALPSRAVPDKILDALGRLSATALAA